jgi:type II secretory pathway pseudopilin PulG
MSAGLDDDPEFRDFVPKPGRARRFSPVRVLMALGIIVLLIALLLPVTRTGRGAARRSQCVNNLKQIALALHNYEQAYAALPPAYTVDAQGRPLHSWRTLILPYLEPAALYNSIDLSKPWNDPANAKAREAYVAAYHCPEVSGPQNTTTYLAIVAPDGCFLPTEPRRLAEITDAHDATEMVIEAGEENAVPWMAPMDAGESLVMSLGTAQKPPHAGGANTCFVNGAVGFLKVSTSAVVRRALISIAGDDDEVARNW